MINSEPYVKRTYIVERLDNHLHEEQYSSVSTDKCQGQGRFLPQPFQLFLSLITPSSKLSSEPLPAALNKQQTKYKDTTSRMRYTSASQCLFDSNSTPSSGWELYYWQHCD